MSAIIRTPECYPERLFPDYLRNESRRRFRPPPNHEACLGGQHTPGVLGGWHCPCPCHQDPPPDDVERQP